MNISSIPQIAVTTDNLSRIIKRDMAIVRLVRQLHTDDITADDMSALIASELKMNANSVKTLICSLRREGIPLPTFARKPRGGGSGKQMSKADRLAVLTMAWNDNGDQKALVELLSSKPAE
jgi:hypothetical protein